MEATITPKYVNPPKDGKKSWSVKDSAGEYWYCTGEVANYIKDMMSQGASVVITYDKKERADGGFWKTIKSAAAANTQALPAQSRPAQAVQGNGRGYDEAQKAEDIFISGAVNQAIAAGQLAVPNADIRAWTHFLTGLRQAWQASKAPPSAQTVAAVMRVPSSESETPF